MISALSILRCSEFDVRCSMFLPEFVGCCSTAPSPLTPALSPPREEGEPLHGLSLACHVLRFTFHAPMKRELTITASPIDEAALRAGRQLSGGMGAVIYFLGV